MAGSLPRLSAEDLLNLSVDGPRTPINVAAVAILGGDCPRIAEIRAEVERRLGAVPRLRQILHSPGRLARPVWIPAARFRVEEHVAELPPVGDEPALMELVARLTVTMLDRSRPLWRMWLVPGLPGGRVALVFVLHHVVADGMGAMHLISALLGDPHEVRTPPAVRRPPQRGRTAGLWMLVRSWPAPRSSLNAPVGPRRRLTVLHLDLASAKAVAHRHGATVNDLVLALAAGGVRALLGARGEPLGRLWINASVAVSLRTPGTSAEAGNRTGGFLVRLPIAEPDPAARLRGVAAATRRAKREQPATTGNRLLAGMARLRVARWFSRHQHLVSVVESDLPGPPAPIHLLGAPVLDVYAVGNLAGNVTLSFLALSYAGRLNITVHADADAVPDLPILIAQIRRDWSRWAAGRGTRSLRV